MSFGLDTGRLRSYHRTMPTWRCPHCGTPQAEASRCWVCRRSSTSCATCRHFRRSVAAQVGFCGLDPRRAPLRGDEIRGCWTAAAEEAAPAPPIDGDRAARRTPVRPRLDFVPVDGAPSPTPSAPPAPIVSLAPRATDPASGGFWPEADA